MSISTLPWWDASPSQGYPQHYILWYPLDTWVTRGTVKVRCLAQEHNTISPAGPRSPTAISRVKRTNYEATMHASHTDNDRLASKEEIYSGTVS